MSKALDVPFDVIVTVCAQIIADGQFVIQKWTCALRSVTCWQC